MDLQVYYEDVRAIQAKLRSEHPDGVVFVTSLFHREKNSTAGHTLSASLRNAARVIADGTHREATKEEADGFLAHQERQRILIARAEQVAKKQYVVVTQEPGQPIAEVISPKGAPLTKDKEVNKVGEKTS